MTNDWWWMSNKQITQKAHDEWGTMNKGWMIIKAYDEWLNNKQMTQKAHDEWWMNNKWF